MSTTLVLLTEGIEVPAIGSLAEFRAWTAADDFPEKGRIDYIQGRIEVDMSPEDIYTHGKVKGEIHRVLANRVKRLALGDTYVDATRIVHLPGDISAEPDILFVSEEALASGRVRLVPKASGLPDRYVEMEGPVDLVVEVVSDSSVEKDTERLPPAYFAAGITEFWLVDARGIEPRFVIYQRGRTAYEPVPAAADGFQRSPVLGAAYRLRRGQNAHGRLTFDLDEVED